MTARDPKRLGEAIRERRGELGLSQAEFAAKAGTGDKALALKTVQRLEAGQVKPRSPTLGAVDRAADWPPGLARAILEGRSEYPPPSRERELDPIPDPADYPDQLEFFNAIYWRLRGQGMSHEAVMRGFHMAAAIYEREKRAQAERDYPPSVSDTHPLSG